LERLARTAPTTTVMITEGEFDAILAEQETGLVTVSSTNGAKGVQAGVGQELSRFPCSPAF